MSSRLAVVRRASLVLGLLMVVQGSLWAQCDCTPSTPPPAPQSFAPLNFGAVALGGSNPRPFAFGCFAEPTTVTPVIVGPDAANFAITGNTCIGLVPANTVCSITITFTPSRCGPHVAFWVLTFTQADGDSCTMILPLTGTGTSTPVPGPPISFPSTLAGAPGACVTLTKPADVTASIVGPGNFTITAQTATTVTVCFTPLAAACGTVTSTLQFISNLTNCPLATFELSGFACSFTCAIGLAGSPNLSAAGRKCILDSLQIAAAVPVMTEAGALTRCAALRCAECCALSELASPIAARRVAAQAVLDQIRCLQAFYGCLGGLDRC